MSDSMSNNIQPKSEPPHHREASVGRYWKTILSNIPDSVTVYDPDGQVVYANDLASKDLRYSSVEHLMQQNIADITDRFICHDEHGALISSEDMPTRRALREQAVVQSTIHFSELDGSDNFWLVAKAFPIIDRRHRLKYVVSTYYEVTSFKEAEAQLRESNRRMLTILDELMDIETDK